MCESKKYPVNVDPPHENFNVSCCEREFAYTESSEKNRMAAFFILVRLFN